MKKVGIIIFAIMIVIVGSLLFSGPRYRNIDGWTSEQNRFVKDYLYETRKISGRKVAVLDVDGTLIGQVPFYLADETMLSYTDENKSDLSQEQQEVIKYMLNTTDTASGRYTRNRVEFFAGMTPEQQSDMGIKIWNEKYGANKIYPEMVQFVRNLQNFGFEVYGITCSPEFVYQGVVTKYYGIPANHVIGAKGVVVDGKMTAKAVEPFPCHEGKRDIVSTFIKENPLIAAGNSGGDSAMVATSVGIKIWVNPNDKLAEECKTDEKCIIVRSNDIDEPGIDWVARKDGLKPNRPESK
ncbi:MAG: haloacid dehalogenase-like hydrolase [Rickettsiales bacterium]|jgi:phosphoserine phosphatase|nr:haloacid dehalogenase-like hydrolase [Rickettsiales bacterium]